MQVHTRASKKHVGTAVSVLRGRELCEPNALPSAIWGLRAMKQVGVR